MSYTSTVPGGAALGVGSIVSESFSILMRKLVSVVALALVPTLIGYAISGLLVGWGPALGVTDPVFTSAGSFLPFALSMVAQIVTYGVTTALLVQLAYDAKLGRSNQLGKYIGPALGAAVPIAVLGFVAGILMAIGLVALVIPGLWIYAVFAVMPAAVVIERVGFGGLGRSAALTKGYRWPILGAVILVGIVNIVIGMIATFVVGLLVAAIGIGAGGIVIGILLLSAISAIGFGLSSIAVALIYARLREIKEGISVRDIAAVFD